MFFLCFFSQFFIRGLFVILVKKESTEGIIFVEIYNFLFENKQFRKLILLFSIRYNLKVIL